MTHMTHTHQCPDGKLRTIHWKNTAKIGDTWTCHRCGNSHILANEGEKAVMKPSKKPPIVTSPSSTSVSDSGCVGIIAALFVASAGLILIFYTFSLNI